MSHPKTSFGHGNVAMDAKAKLDTEIPTCRVGTSETVAMFGVSWNDKFCRLQKWHSTSRRVMARKIRVSVFQDI
jgi:hypothetical protein